MRTLAVMDATLTALLLGAGVGLGIALPLGAIGVLLLQTGMTAGWRTAAAGGLGAATVDTAYATISVLTGTGVAATLANHARVVQLLGAAVLVVVATRGLLGLRRTGGRAVPVVAVGDDRGAGAVAGFGRFLALTAVNPLTVVYFAAVAAGLSAHLATASQRIAFVVGIGAASATWQLVLAAAGALLGARVRPAVRTGLTAAGYAVVVGFAVLLAVP